MKKLFGSKEKVTAIGAPDAKVIFTKFPIQYKQFLLDKNFTQYLKIIMISNKNITYGCAKNTSTKTYEMYVSSDSINVEFFRANIQFDWLEISLIYDKSEKHTTIYESYNPELAAKMIKSIKLENFTDIYSLTNEKNIP